MGIQILWSDRYFEILSFILIFLGLFGLLLNFALEENMGAVSFESIPYICRSLSIFANCVAELMIDFQIARLVDSHTNWSCLIPCGPFLGTNTDSVGGK